MDHPRLRQLQPSFIADFSPLLEDCNVPRCYQVRVDRVRVHLISGRDDARGIRWEKVAEGERNDRGTDRLIRQVNEPEEDREKGIDR